MTYKFWTTVDQEGLNSLNTTNYRIVIGIRLACLTVFVALAAFVYELLKVSDHHDHSDALTILEYNYLFLGAVLGLGTVAYGLKRFSDTDMIQKRETAKAGASAPSVVQTTGTVVQQNPGGPVDTGGTTAQTPITGKPENTPEPNN